MFMQSHHGIKLNFLRLAMSQECPVVFESVILITECISSSIDCMNYILGTTCLHLPPPAQGRLNSRNWSGGREGRARQMQRPTEWRAYWIGSHKIWVLTLISSIFVMLFWTSGKGSHLEYLENSAGCCNTLDIDWNWNEERGSIRKTPSYLLPLCYWASASLPSHLFICITHSFCLHCPKGGETAVTSETLVIGSISSHCWLSGHLDWD